MLPLDMLKEICLWCDVPTLYNLMRSSKIFLNLMDNDFWEDRCAKYQFKYFKGNTNWKKMFKHLYLKIYISKVIKTINDVYMQVSRLMLDDSPSYEKRYKVYTILKSLISENDIFFKKNGEDIILFVDKSDKDYDYYNKLSTTLFTNKLFINDETKFLTHRINYVIYLYKLDIIKRNKYKIILILDDISHDYPVLEF